MAQQDHNNGLVFVMTSIMVARRVLYDNDMGCRTQGPTTQQHDRKRLICYTMAQTFEPQRVR
eukprot:8468157-Lingulodinium_polyedra.AAC.1